MIDQIQNIIQPIIVDYAAWVILALAGWFLRRLPEQWRIEIEAKHREALHAALNTGVGLVIDSLQKNSPAAVPDMAISKVISYVRNSVPDAIKNLAPSQEQLEMMARSKITAALDQLVNRDRLAEALRNARA